MENGINGEEKECLTGLGLHTGTEERERYYVPYRIRVLYELKDIFVGEFPHNCVYIRWLELNICPYKIFFPKESQEIVLTYTIFNGNDRVLVPRKVLQLPERGGIANALHPLDIPGLIVNLQRLDTDESGRFSLHTEAKNMVKISENGFEIFRDFSSEKKIVYQKKIWYIQNVNLRLSDVCQRSSQINTNFIKIVH